MSVTLCANTMPNLENDRHLDLLRQRLAESDLRIARERGLLGIYQTLQGLLHLHFDILPDL
jgi:hypothetical protein